MKSKNTVFRFDLAASQIELVRSTSKLWALCLIAVLSTACRGPNDPMKSGLSKMIGSPGASSFEETNPTPVPTPYGTPDPSGQGKVFNKNPLFAGAPSAYTVRSTGVTPANPINFDQYLTTVSISGTTGGLLENSTLKVLTDVATSFNSNGYPIFSASSVQRARPDSSGNWFYSSIGDSNHRLGQLMAYYWINKMSDDMEAKLVGGSYIKGKNTKLYSYCYNATTTGSPGLNAFWAGSYKYACMSYQSHFESSYDASVYVHEMGHGNIDYATNFNFSASAPANEGECSDMSAQCCSTASGCPGAINEGQADFHSQMIFNSGAVGEFFVNSINGLGSRDSSQNGSLTAAQMFATTSSGGTHVGREIHYMGAVWSASLWTMRQNIGATDSDKIFLFSLATLRATDTFRTALSKTLAAAVQLKNSGKIASNYANEITTAFAQHGISPQ